MKKHIQLTTLLTFWAALASASGPGNNQILSKNRCDFLPGDLQTACYNKAGEGLIRCSDYPGDMEIACENGVFDPATGKDYEPIASGPGNNTELTAHCKITKVYEDNFYDSIKEGRGLNFKQGLFENVLEFVNLEEGHVLDTLRNSDTHETVLLTQEYEGESVTVVVEAYMEETFYMQIYSPNEDEKEFPGVIYFNPEELGSSIFHRESKKMADISCQY